MRLISLSTKGLKGTDVAINLGPVHVIAGENGEGKSTILVALYLLVFGRVSSPMTSTSALDTGAKVAATNDGVMLLARGKQLRAEGVWQRQDKSVIRVTRTWTRKGAKVQEDIDASGIGDPGMSTRDLGLLIQRELGPSLDLFFPADMLGLSPDKLRTRLLRAVAADLGAVSAWVPEDLPEWAAPAAEEEAPLDWIAVAKHRAAERLKEDQDEVRTLERLLADLEDAWGAPVSADAIRARLEALEAEGQRAKERATKAAEVERLRGEVERHESAADKLDAARVEFDEAKADGARYAEALEVWTVENDRRMRLDTELGRVSRQVRDLAGVQPVTAEDLTAASNALRDAEHRRQQAEARLSSARGVAALFSGQCPIPECPSCGAGLSEAFAQLKADADVALVRAAEEADAAEDAVDDGLRAVDLARDGLALAEAQTALTALQMERDAITETKRPTIDGDRVLRARRTLTEAERADAVLDDIRGRLEIAEAELEEMPAGRSRDEVAAEYRATQAEIEALGEMNARKNQRQEAADGIEVMRTQVVKSKALVEQLKRVHQDMLAAASGVISRRFESATGAPVEVLLEDERGKDTCRLTVGGVNVAALSGGEMLMWLAANVITLAPSTSAAWRPLLLDRIEAVSKGKRGAFLGAVAQAFREGLITQAILTGCPDSVPEVEGVTVTVLKSAQQEVAA